MHHHVYDAYSDDDETPSINNNNNNDYDGDNGYGDADYVGKEISHFL